MSVSRAHVHAGLACARALLARLFFLAQVNENDVSASTYLHCPGSFLRLACACCRLSGSFRCNKSGSSAHALGLCVHALAFPSCSAPHSIACASFSLCMVLSLWCPPRSTRTSSLWLCSAQWGSLSAWLCSVVLRLVPCFAYWAARILRNGPPQLYFWVLTGFNLPKWTFQVVLRLACLLLFLSVCHTKRLQSVQKWSERVVFLTCKLRHVLPGKKQRAFFFDMWMFTSGSIFLKHDLQQRFPPQRCSLFFVRSTSTSVPALVLTRCVRATILRPWADLSILWMHKSLENHIVLRL